jgi:hypothetical protein
MIRDTGWLNTDISGLPIGQIFKGSVSWPLKVEQIRSPETSVLNQPTLRNIPEDNRIQVNRKESLRFPIMLFSLEFQPSTALLSLIPTFYCIVESNSNLRLHC